MLTVTTMKKDILNKSPEDFFEALSEMRGIGKINLHLGRLIYEMASCDSYKMDDDVLKFFYLLLSLQEDGNTCFAIDESTFLNKWATKWNSLVELKLSENPKAELAQAQDFAEIIKKGISYILGDQSLAIVERRTVRKKSKDIKDIRSTKLFVLFSENNGTLTLYATKYFDAKCTIESAGQTIFKRSEKPSDVEIQNYILESGKLMNFSVNSKQAEAILRGAKENLIVTGGPGTGKTTVVVFLLWNLLKSNFEEYKNWQIHLAAPSGKAADRMRESLAKALNEDIKKDSLDTEEKRNIHSYLSNLESSTIHRLLHYSAKESGFAINEKNKFSEKSIFVIDEASMIDINLFASFLQALPEKDVKVFVLGDPFQLPSVDAGAVLGEILNSRRAREEFVVELEESRRFTAESNIGKLAYAIKDCALANNTSGSTAVPQTFFTKNTSIGTPKENTVNYISIEGETSKQEEEQSLDLIKSWNSFFFDFPRLAAEIHPRDEQPDLAEQQRRKDLWNTSLQKRMLSAERGGNRGVFQLNKITCESIQEYVKETNKEIKERNKALAQDSDKENTISMYSGKYFPGELLILTENQSMYKLYNGDTGIVIFDKESKVPYLMLKKAPPKKLKDISSQKEKGDFVFYPLSLLPEESLEPAFAITIHKSQGSEYDHVLMFLPKQKGHPLLTNQILYTGITRAKESVTIIATEETFQAACCTVTERETGIEL